MKKYTEEQCEALKQADLVEYVQSHGFSCKKAGKEYHVEGYGGLYINPKDNTWYCHSEGIGGRGISSFSEKYLAMQWKDVMREIFGEPTGEWKEPVKAVVNHEYEAQYDENDEKEQKELVMPERDDNTKRVYAYLAYERGISSKIINDFIKKGLLYQEKGRGNAVFVHKDDDGQIKGADTRGTVSKVQYRGIATGSDMNYGFEYTKGKTEKVYVFEAAIDMMSYIQLHPEIDNAKFVAMCGLKPKVIERYIESGMNVISCVDNDEVGQDFNNKILCSVMSSGLKMGNKEENIYRGRKPPIRYVTGSIDGKTVGLFLSKQDYADITKSGEYDMQTSFVLVNKKNFQICNECKDYGCKDFNDLLKKKQAFAEYKGRVKMSNRNFAENKSDITRGYLQNVRH